MKRPAVYSNCLLLLTLPILAAACGSGQRTQPLPCEQSPCAARNQLIESIRIIQSEGARPRFAPSGEAFVFDRVNADGYADLYISDLSGNILRSLTDGRTNLPQKSNGNGVYDPTGQFILFVSEAESHFADQMKYLGNPALAVASDFSPDGSYLAGTIGVDFGEGARRDMVLKIILIRLGEPWWSSRRRRGCRGRRLGSSGGGVGRGPARDGLSRPPWARGGTRE